MWRTFIYMFTEWGSLHLSTSVLTVQNKVQ